LTDNSLPAAGSASADREDSMLRGLAEKLESRGLDASLVTYPVAGVKGKHFDAVIAVNPAAPERGRVHIQKKGLVLWECTGTLDEAGAGKILDDVTNVLRGRGCCFGQEPRS
jgi:hypothetical protein